MTDRFLSRLVPFARGIAISLVAIGASFLAPPLAHGQASGIKSVDSRDIEMLETKLENFFTTLASDAPMAGPDPAFQALLAGGPLLANEEGIKQAIERAKQLPKLYGQYNGFEKVKQVSVGKDVCEMTYLYKGRLYPVTWQFIFYRADSSFPWVCIGVRFRSTVEDLAK